MTQKIHILFLFLLINLFLFSQKLDSIPNGKGVYFGNLFRINDSMYRSDQPTFEGMKSLEKLGIKSVLNLRNLKSDKPSNSIVLYHKRINTWTMNEKELIEALKILQQVEKPMLIHCHHGADRTGTVVAAYRIIYENWSREAAIKEMVEGNFNFHGNFQNLIRLLESFDIEKAKKELGVK